MFYRFFFLIRWRGLHLKCHEGSMDHICNSWSSPVSPICRGALFVYYEELILFALYWRFPFLLKVPHCLRVTFLDYHTNCICPRTDMTFFDLVDVTTISCTTTIWCDDGMGPQRSTMVSQHLSGTLCGWSGMVVFLWMHCTIYISLPLWSLFCLSHGRRNVFSDVFVCHYG